MKVAVWEDAGNYGHGVYVRNIVLAESGLPEDQVYILISGTDPTTDYPRYVIEYQKLGYYSLYEYCVDNNFTLINRSYAGMNSSVDRTAYQYLGAAGIGMIRPITDSDAMETLGYTTTPGKEYPLGTPTSVSGTGLEFRVLYDGHLSGATGKVTGIIAKMLVDHPTWNYFDARAALRQTASQFATGWDTTYGYGSLDVDAARALTDASALALFPPAIFRAVVEYTGGQSIVHLTWANFAQTRFSETVIVKYDTEPTRTSTPNDAGATILYSGTAESYDWSGIADGTYWLAVFTKDAAGNYSTLGDFAKFSVDVTYWEPAAPRTATTLYLNNESGNIVQDGLSWATCFTELSQLSGQTVADDALYIKPTSIPYKGALPDIRYIYGNATANGTELGTSYALFEGCDDYSIHDTVYDSVNDVYTLTGILPVRTTAQVWLQHTDTSGVIGLTNVSTINDCYSTPQSFFLDVADTFINFGTLAPAQYTIKVPTLDSLLVAKTIEHGEYLEARFYGYDTFSWSTFIPENTYLKNIRGYYNYIGFLTGFSLFSSTGTFTLEGFEFSYNTLYGIENLGSTSGASKTQDVKFRYGVVAFNGSHGVQNREPRNGYDIYENVISAFNDGYGFFCVPLSSYSNYTSCHNCISAFNASGQYYAHDFTGVNFTADYNIAYTNDLINAPNYDGKWEAGKGSHSIEADPQFMDAAYGEFSLKPASPAIAAGQFRGYRGLDVYGNPATKGGYTDIGAVAYQGIKKPRLEAAPRSIAASRLARAA